MLINAALVSVRCWLDVLSCLCVVVHGHSLFVFCSWTFIEFTVNIVFWSYRHDFMEKLIVTRQNKRVLLRIGKLLSLFLDCVFPGPP